MQAERRKSARSAARERSGATVFKDVGDESKIEMTTPPTQEPQRLMDLTAFRRSVAAPAPPTGLDPALEALWHDARGDFDRAHELAQSDEGGAGDWVHAYLHRKEGDFGNAAYWYRRARKPVCRETLDAEWEAIVRTLLAAAPD